MTQEKKYCDQKLGRSQNSQTLKKNVKEKCYKYKNTQSPKTTARGKFGNLTTKEVHIN